MGEGWKLATFQPGFKLTQQRKILRKAIGPQAVASYEEAIQSEIMTLLDNFSGFSGDPYLSLAR
jgi:cytochrome P450